jgi:hypothetical protein
LGGAQRPPASLSTSAPREAARSAVEGLSAKSHLMEPCLSAERPKGLLREGKG